MKQKVRKNGVVCWECLCQPKRFFLKTTNLPEVILVTIALSVCMHLRNHENFLKMKHKNFTLGGFCPGGFCLGGFCPGGLCPGGFCPGVFVLEPKIRALSTGGNSNTDFI